MSQEAPRSQVFPGCMRVWCSTAGARKPARRFSALMRPFRTEDEPRTNPCPPYCSDVRLQLVTVDAYSAFEVRTLRHA